MWLLRWHRVRRCKKQDQGWRSPARGPSWKAHRYLVVVVSNRSVFARSSWEPVSSSKVRNGRASTTGCAKLSLLARFSTAWLLSFPGANSGDPSPTFFEESRSSSFISLSSHVFLSSLINLGRARGCLARLSIVICQLNFHSNMSSTRPAFGIVSSITTAKTSYVSPSWTFFLPLPCSISNEFINYEWIHRVKASRDELYDKGILSIIF